MFFKPKIFISSTFGENEYIRDKIEKIFLENGAEPLLYETNLTPSVKPRTYRSDLLEADFVIIIIKEKYGTPTVDTGKSGLHEEIILAINNNKPIHLYLKKTVDCDEMLLEVKGIINNYGISYYYFENDDELLARIQETTFTIAKEISSRNLITSSLPKAESNIIATNCDYNIALNFMRRFEELKMLSSRFDIIRTDFFLSITDPVYEWSKGLSHIFIDGKLNDLFIELIEIADEFNALFGTEYVSSKILGEFQTQYNGAVTIHCSNPCNGTKNHVVAQLEQLVKSFFDKYDVFCSYALEKKKEADMMRTVNNSYDF